MARRERMQFERPAARAEHRVADGEAHGIASRG
jgi:hypothetical protein